MFLIADLGVTKSHSRPHISNDHPYPEAHLKTLKYRPEFPTWFGSREDARVFRVWFFGWCNRAHRRSGISTQTPADVHHGRASIVREQPTAADLIKADAVESQGGGPSRYLVTRAQVLTRHLWVDSRTV